MSLGATTPHAVLLDTGGSWSEGPGIAAFPPPPLRRDAHLGTLAARGGTWASLSEPRRTVRKLLPSFNSTN